MMLVVSTNLQLRCSRRHRWTDEILKSIGQSSKVKGRSENCGGIQTDQRLTVQDRLSSSLLVTSYHYITSCLSVCLSQVVRRTTMGSGVSRIHAVPRTHQWTSNAARGVRSTPGSASWMSAACLRHNDVMLAHVSRRQTKLRSDYRSTSPLATRAPSPR